MKGVLPLVAAVLISAASSALGSTSVEPTLEQQTCSSELIVAGELSNVKPKYMAVSFDSPGSEKAFYDLGHILNPQVIKQDGQPHHSAISVIFLSDRTDASQHFHSGDSGIWFLRRDYLSGSYLVLPFSPRPLTYGEAVENISKSKKCGRKLKA